MLSTVIVFLFVSCFIFSIHAQVQLCNINAHGVRVLDALAASIEEVAAGEAGT